MAHLSFSVFKDSLCVMYTVWRQIFEEHNFCRWDRRDFLVNIQLVTLDRQNCKPLFHMLHMYRNEHVLQFVLCGSDYIQILALLYAKPNMKVHVCIIIFVDTMYQFLQH